MKKEETFNEEAELRALEQIAPWVNEGFARMGGPSDRILKAIHDEAVAQVSRPRVRSFRFAFAIRLTAAAAAVMLLVSGVVFQSWQSRKHEQQHQVVQILHMTTKSPLTEESEGTEPAELANLLLTVQGLDRESYFSGQDGTEALWL
jgi:hypothetical protein